MYLDVQQLGQLAVHTDPHDEAKRRPIQVDALHTLDDHVGQIASLQLRAILWLLYQRSNREREPYTSLRTTMTQERRADDISAAYTRATYARTHWNGIVRTLEASPEPISFHDEIGTLIQVHGRKRRP